MTQNQDLYTSGDLARALHVARHRVEFILLSRRIDPVCRIGGTRAFNAEALSQVAIALEEIQTKRATHVQRA